MPTDYPQDLTLEFARAEFERTTLARAQAYADSDGSSAAAKRSAFASRDANDARRAYERAILAQAGLPDPGLGRLP